METMKRGIAVLICLCAIAGVVYFEHQQMGH